MTLPEQTRTPDPRRWKALSVLLFVQFMLILDVSVVSIALPEIKSDLGFSASGLTWVVDAYVLVAGGLLLLGGRLGDVLGRRRTFLVGVGIFGVSSIVCGLAQNPGQLVAARFVQGLGEALAAPAALGLIALLFSDPKERAKAIGFFGGAAGLGGTAGPIVSGALVEYSTWRLIFLINIPVALVALFLVPRLVDVSRATGSFRTLDLPSAVLVTAGAVGVVFGAIEAATNDWGSAQVLVPLLGGLALLVAFAAYQRVAANPLVPPRFVTDRTRVAANVVTIFFFAVFFSQFFFLTLYLQDVRGFGALRTGLGFLPFGLVLGAGIGAATSLLPKVGPRPVMCTGLLLSGLGVLAYTRITPDGSYTTQVLPGLLLLAAGSGLVLTSLSNAAVHAVTEDDAGLASGLQQAVQQIAGAVGLAVLLTVALRQAGSAGASDPGAAITDGYVLAFRIAAGLVAVGLVVAFALLRGTSPQDARTPEGVAV